jgi:GntR family transcriptional repressor for pyruvate dehydrogenase complex
MTPDRQHPVTPSRLAAADSVVAHVRDGIQRGLFKSGDRLPPERDLAHKLGVSRPSVRSGLHALAGMGVVRIRQGAGTFIMGGPPALDSEPLNMLAALHGFTRSQMFEARVSLEVQVAGMAAQRATAETLIAISDETTAMFASLDNPDAFLVHDIRFHRGVAAAADNPVLCAVVEMVSTAFHRLRQQTIGRARDLKDAAEEHRAIYQAIRARDVERARRAMADHLRRAERTQALEETAAEGLVNRA